MAFLKSGAWIPIAALIIGAVVRLLKSDTPLPTVPPKWRPVLALVLGLVAGVLTKVASGIDWQTALEGGLGAASIAIFGHDFVVAGLRDGKEPFAPKDDDAGPPPPSASGGGFAGPGLMCLAVLALAFLVSCSPGMPTPVQQARFGTYEAALQACNAKLAADKAAAEADGGRADRPTLRASYVACANGVDVTFGRADGGAR